MADPTLLDPRKRRGRPPKRSKFENEVQSPVGHYHDDSPSLSTQTFPSAVHHHRPRIQGSASDEAPTKLSKKERGRLVDDDAFSIPVARVSQPRTVLVKRPRGSISLYSSQNSPARTNSASTGEAVNQPSALLDVGTQIEAESWNDDLERLRKSLQPEEDACIKEKNFKNGSRAQNGLATDDSLEKHKGTINSHEASSAGTVAGNGLPVLPPLALPMYLSLAHVEGLNPNAHGHLRIPVEYGQTEITVPENWNIKYYQSLAPEPTVAVGREDATKDGNIASDGEEIKAESAGNCKVDDSDTLPQSDASLDMGAGMAADITVEHKDVMSQQCLGDYLPVPRGDHHLEGDVTVGAESVDAHTVQPIPSVPEGKNSREIVPENQDSVLGEEEEGEEVDAEGEGMEHEREGAGMKVDDGNGKKRGRPAKKGGRFRKQVSGGSKIAVEAELGPLLPATVEAPARNKRSKKRGRPPVKGVSSLLLPCPAEDDLAGQEDEEDEEEEDDSRDNGVMDSVVKVFCVHTEPNYSLPWQKKRQYNSSSSGFMIGGRMVLTNAHSVDHYTIVKVKKRGSDVKYIASVLAIGTECDIALLSVEEESFWDGTTPVQFGPLPCLQDPVTVVGYPIGGDSISVTSGVVSRIEVTAYAHGSSELLGVQIDAAINSGNSGGPAFNGHNECVGIAFQSLKEDDSENIGYIIPTPVIDHFITDYKKNGAYTGFPSIGIEWQKMENADLRRAMKMGTDQKGVLIRRIEPTSPVAKVLLPSDVLLSFDGVEIANDGTVPFRRGERISFRYLVSEKYSGEEGQLLVLRSGQVREFSVKLNVSKRLIPMHSGGHLPSYYIIAGLVFTTVSVPYLRSEYGKTFEYEAPVKLLDKLMHKMADDADEEVVVLSQVLAADVNVGYEEIINTQVTAFNGCPVKSLKHLVFVVEGCSEQFMRFDLEYSQMVILDTVNAKMSTAAILATHSIPVAMSADLSS